MNVRLPMGTKLMPGSRTLRAPRNRRPKSIRAYLDLTGSMYEDGWETCSVATNMPSAC